MKSPMPDPARPVLGSIARQYLYQNATYHYEYGTPENDERLAHYEGRLDGAIELLEAHGYRTDREALIAEARRTLIENLRSDILVLRDAIVAREAAARETPHGGTSAVPKERSSLWKIETLDQLGLYPPVLQNVPELREELHYREEALDRLLAKEHGIYEWRYELAILADDDYLPIDHFYTEEVAALRRDTLRAVYPMGDGPRLKQAIDEDRLILTERC